MQFLAAEGVAQVGPTPRVAALITTILSNPQKLQDAVAATVAAGKAASVPFEVICVVNEPRVTPPALPGCRVVTSGLNLGYAGGLQLARSLTDADVLWILQDDMNFEASLLSKLLSEVQRHPDAGVIAPTVLGERSNTINIRGGMFDPELEQQLWHPTIDLNKTAPMASLKLNWLSLAGALVPVRAWDEVGGPDAAFFPLQYVDIDFGYRLTMAGYRMTPIPTAQVEHEIGGSSAGMMKRFLNVDAEKRMRAKHLPKPQLGTDASQPVEMQSVPNLLVEKVAQSASLSFIDFAQFANREINLLRAELAQVKAENYDSIDAPELDVANQQLRLRAELDAVRRSFSWRITAPLRRVGAWVLKIRHG